MMHEQLKTTVEVESVGTVTVSTVQLKRYRNSTGWYAYWETAILWPDDWEAADYCEDGTAFTCVDYSEEEAEAAEQHDHWADAETIAPVVERTLHRMRVTQERQRLVGA